MPKARAMGKKTLVVVIALVCVGALLGGAAARSRPRAPVAAAVERLVLGGRDAPGLKTKRASAALAAKTVAKALRPARLPGLPGEAQASHLVRGSTNLLSLAYVQKSNAAAKSQLQRLVKAVSRAGLRRRRAPVGEEGWLIAAGHGGSALVVWRRRNAVGEILLTAKLTAKPLHTVAVQYASVSDFHMQHLLSLDAWQRTLGRIRPNGTVPRKVALDLFALAYAPLPGTKRPRGPYGPIPDGTLAGTEILRIWSTLTPAQRAAAAQALGITQPGAARRPAGPSKPRGLSVSPGICCDPTFVADAELQKLVDGFALAYAKQLPWTLRYTIVAGRSTANSNAYADTQPVDSNGVPSFLGPICRIRLLPPGQEADTAFRNLALAHETFHCFQGDIRRANGPPWLIEGMADWAALSIDPVSWDVGSGNIQTYLNTPGTPLFERTYDAVGFFGHAEDTTSVLWPRVVKILTAPDSVSSYLRAGGAYSTMVDSWGSSTFNLSKLSQAWTMMRPLPTPAAVKPWSTPVIGSTSVNIGAYALARYDLDTVAMRQMEPERPLLHVQIDGWARLGILVGETPYDRTDLKDAWFWLGEGEPKCPAGQEGTPPPATLLRGIAPLALTGDRTGTQGTLTLVSLDRYCKEKQKPPKPPTGGPAGGGGGGGGGSGGGGGGSSFADPHFVTFDGTWYAYQGAGEYTLARSRSGDLEVQARQQPFPGTSLLSKALAINTAIAMRVAGDRVGVYMPDLSVRVDGKGFVPTLKPRRLPRGGRIRLIEGQIEVIWPDGSLVRVFAQAGLSVLVQPAHARQGTLQGLFGDFDANPRNDFVTRSGKRLNADEVTSSFRLLYRVFGDSWRITQGQSLFDYARGQSTRTFQKLGFPNVPALLRDLKAQQRRYAERYCRSLHIKRPEVFGACLLDVGATGNAAFATAAAQAERTGGGFPAPRKAVKPKKGAKPGVKGATTWTRLPGKATGSVSAALAGGKVVAAYLTGQGSAEAVTFTPSAGRDASGPRRDPITSGWGTLGDPLLLERLGGGLQVLLTGTHSNNSGDPLNGVAFAPRNPDGSFGAPVPATASTFAEFVTGAAALAPDGAPLWASDRGGTLWLWRGATGSAGSDLSGIAGGQVVAASVARDRSGRYWLAWDAAFSSQAQRVGLYLVQFDPTTLTPLGAPQQAPASGGRSYTRLALACAATCRLVYMQPHKLGGARVVSWAPGEPAPTTVADFGRGHGIGEPAAVYAPGGRLWTAWWDNTGRADYGYRAVLGDTRGAKGTPFTIGRPAGGSGAALALVASGESLVVTTSVDALLPYVNVVAPR
jgi:hypothetical protein